MEKCRIQKKKKKKKKKILNAKNAKSAKRMKSAETDEGLDARSAHRWSMRSAAVMPAH